jgi:hypothetical protein
MRKILSITTASGKRYKVGKDGVVLIDLQTDHHGTAVIYWYIICAVDGPVARISTSQVITITYKTNGKHNAS